MVVSGSKKKHWFYAPSLDPSLKRIELGDEELIHARVKRIRKGEEIVLFDGKGRVAKALIARFSKNRLICEIQKIKEVEKYGISVNFYVALHSEIKKFVRNASSVSFDSINVFPARRSNIKNKKTSDLLKQLIKSAVEGCKQSENPFIPGIKILTSLEEIISDDSSLNYVLHPEGTDINEEKIESPESVNLIAGPEGGFDDKEIKLLLLKNFKIVRICRSIVKTELLPLFMAGFLKGRGLII